ncbi:MAG: hypothetical protein PHI70_09945 [Proteiniphilum sp.]|nr:hypothetical protein [Proteiniphilum sp.]
MPQDLEVFGPSEDSDYDYSPVRPETVTVVNSELVDEESDEEPRKTNICVIGDWFA